MEWVAILRFVATMHSMNSLRARDIKISIGTKTALVDYFEC